MQRLRPAPTFPRPACPPSTALLAAFTLILSGALPSAALAQDAVPSPGEVLGHAVGERFTDHAGVVRYMEALSAASGRVDMHRYGTTVEGRPLIRVVFAREDRMSDLEAILDRNRELADPDTPEARAREIVRDNPGVAYLSYGIHGRESSSSEAAIWMAWNLARGAPEVDGILDSLIVVMDPVLNPDGRDRYVHWYRQARGLNPNPHPDSWEHVEPWPGGRFNHYLFDLNRDWSWATQPETRARRAEWSRWTPQVHVDFHEMGLAENYLFFPANDPINPLFPESTIRWHERFGDANSEAFDAKGWPYYTGEWFDFWYPGYGDTWASFYGAIGMTYEQGGSGAAGLAVHRPDGLTLTLRDRADGHRTAGEATLRAAARSRHELLTDFATFHRTAGEGLPDIFLVPGEDPGPAEALVRLLRTQEIQVRRATRSFRAGTIPHEGFEARDGFPAGTFHVPARQPWGRLALALLLPEIELDATYTYDASSWALPYGYGVEAHRVSSVPEAGWEPVLDLEPRSVEIAPLAPYVSGGLHWSAWDEDVRLGAAGSRTATDGEGAVEGASGSDPPYGYLLPPGFESGPGLVTYLERGGRALVMVEDLTLGAVDRLAGTVWLPRLGVDRVSERVVEAGLAGRAVPIRTGRSDDGRDLGTGTAIPLTLPRVGVVMGDGVSPTSFGSHWFFLEQTVGLPFDALPLHTMGRISLDAYDVLVFPELTGGGGIHLSDAVLERLEDWVRRGGTLVAVGSGARRLAEPLAGVGVRERATEEDPDQARLLALRGRNERDVARWERQIPGTVLPVVLDTAHPLAFGIGADGSPGRMFIFHQGPTAFEPDESFESVAYFPADLREVSGVMSAENRDFLSLGTWLAYRTVGAGKVILFADDPVHRHFWYAGFKPYLNALLIAPGM